MHVKSNIIALTVVGLAAITQQAQAGDGRYLWSDKNGLQPLGNCQKVLHEDSGLAVVVRRADDNSPAHPLVDASGNRGKYVVDRTLVKKLLSTEVNSTQEIEVVAIPTNASPLNRQNDTDLEGLLNAQKGTEGFIKNENLNAIDNLVVELSDSDANLNIKNLQHQKDSLKNTFWQSSIENNQTQFFSCKKNNERQEYIVFNVYSSEKIDPIAQIGLPKNELSIFKKIKIHSSDEAEAIIEELNQINADKKYSSLGASKNLSSAQTTTSMTRNSFLLSQEALDNQENAIAQIESKRKKQKQTNTTNLQNTDSQKSKNALSDLINSTTNTSTGYEFILCTKNASLPIFDQKIKKQILTAKKFETVIPVQSWNTNNSQTDYVQVQLPYQKGQMGWVAQVYVKQASDCTYYSKTVNQLSDTVNLNDNSTVPQKKTASTDHGLKDSSCCEFPLQKRPTQSYKEGMRRFRANRPGNRIHAACDLYGNKGDNIKAVTDGSVIRSKYYYYEGVYALEVLHTGGFVALYGEILGKNAPGTKAGSSIYKGQTVGYMGMINSGGYPAMLHFELYAGTESGRLSQFKRKPFERRADLLDPTTYLSTWEFSKFGVSY